MSYKQPVLTYYIILNTFLLKITPEMNYKREKYTLI